MDDLDRMFRRLVENIRTGYPEYLSKPFEISELYQNLIPYRHNRRDLGIETNQDYELTLMRLLSGARGYVYGDESMQEYLRQELASPNPDTSAFRAYSGTTVSIAPEALRRPDHAGSTSTGVTPSGVASLSTGRSGSHPPAPRLVVDPASSAAPAPMPPRPATPLPSSAPSLADTVSMRSYQPPTGAPMANPQRPAGGTCRYCSGALPEGRRIVFCPHCGQNLTIQHCPACSTELDINWKFCTTCGRAVGG